MLTVDNLLNIVLLMFWYVLSIINNIIIVYKLLVVLMNALYYAKFQEICGNVRCKFVQK